MTYKIENMVGSPRLHLLNKLIKEGIYSNFPKEGYFKVDKKAGYYFVTQLLENNFDLSNSIYGKTSNDFMEVSGFSRPKINNYIERHGRVVYLSVGYYDIPKLMDFMRENMKEYIEKRGRKCKSI